VLQSGSGRFLFSHGRTSARRDCAASPIAAAAESSSRETLAPAREQTGLRQRGELAVKCVGGPARQPGDLAQVKRFARMQEQQSENVAPVRAEEEFARIQARSIVANFATISAFIATTVKPS
jgi:hypothetical protein